MTTDYRYTAQREEAGIGLYYYNARWYDPALGRFISADTVTPGSDGMAWERYAYVRNNPLKYTDPSGNKECDGASTSACIHVTTPQKKAETISYLQRRYRWNVPGTWSFKEVDRLGRSADKISMRLTKIRGSSGSAWLRDRVGDVGFARGDCFGRACVPGRTTVWLPRGWDDRLDADAGVVAHELGHVVDNALGPADVPATWTGGGPGDALMEEVGIRGRDLYSPRWARLGLPLPERSRFPDEYVASYGNGGPADYFATAFSLTILDPGSVPTIARGFMEGLMRNGY